MMCSPTSGKATTQGCISEGSAYLNCFLGGGDGGLGDAGLAL
jgi:hypothetical protein